MTFGLLLRLTILQKHRINPVIRRGALYGFCSMSFPTILSTTIRLKACIFRNSMLCKPGVCPSQTSNQLGTTRNVCFPRFFPESQWKRSVAASMGGCVYTTNPSIAGPSSTRRSRFSELPTTHGRYPAVVGWHNPYCRTYARVLSACSWQASSYFWFPLEQLGAPEEQLCSGKCLFNCTQLSADSVPFNRSRSFRGCCNQNQELPEDHGSGQRAHP